MFDQLKDKLPHLTEMLEKFSRYYKRVEVPARTVLLQEGEVSKKSFLIEKGCLRVWFNNNGRDVTFQFFFEGQGLSSIESFRKNIPSIFAIETIEPCVLHVLKKTDYEMIIAELGQDSMFLNHLIDIMFERQLFYMREFLSFIRDTPQQRYENLIRNKPQLLQRVPQHYIASYLGISSVHLSRIRNRAVKEKR